MAISVVINAVGVSDYTDPFSITWTRTLNGRGTFSLVLKTPTGGFVPLVGHSFSVGASGVGTLFTGTISEVVRTRLGNETDGYRYDVSGTDATNLLDRHVLPTNLYYVGQASGTIFQDLVGKVIGGVTPEGITYGTITAGATIPFIEFAAGTRLTEAFDQLATLNNYVWWVSAVPELHFGPRTVFPASFTLDAPKVRRASDDSYSLRKHRDDVRNRQTMRIATAAFPVHRQTYQGDGVTQVFGPLRRRIAEPVSIKVTTGTRSSVAGTFTGLPSNGQTMTIDGIVYTWRTAVDNLAEWQIKIGATAGECAENMALCINDAAGQVNGAGEGKGTAWSWPSYSHPTCEASASGSVCTVRYNQRGTDGNSVTVSEAMSNFSWASGTMSGGTNGTDTDQTIGLDGEDADWLWHPTIATNYQSGFGLVRGPGRAALSGTEYVEFGYRPVDGDVIILQDDAAITARAAVEGGSSTGRYANHLDDTGISDIGTAYAKGRALIDTYKNDAQVLEFQTDEQGLQAGHLLTVDTAKPAVSGTWLIETIRANYVPRPPRPDQGFFRYTVTAVDGTRIGSWLTTWESFANSGGGSGSGSVTMIGSGGGSPAPGGSGITTQREAQTVNSNGYSVTTSKVGTLEGDELILELTVDGSQRTITVGSVFEDWSAGQFDGRPSKRNVYNLKWRVGTSKWQLVSYRLGL